MRHKQCVHAHFICLSKPNLLRQEVVTITRAVVLFIVACAECRSWVWQMLDASWSAIKACVAAVLGKLNLTPASLVKLSMKELKVLEGRVVLADLALIIKGEPNVDFEWSNIIQRGVIECNNSRRRNDVTICGEFGDFVRHGYTQKGSGRLNY